MGKVKADYLIEASWEVCNKVGGIYTVVKSKAALVNNEYPNYFLIGPYVHKKAKLVFVEEDIPEDCKTVVEKLSVEGIICHYGTWQVKGNPKVILLDFNNFANKKDEFKKAYWDNFQVDSLGSGWDFEEPLVWATAVGKLIQAFAETHDSGKKIVAHFHEWLAGFALLYLKMNKIKVGTVFTTHATMLGRTIASSGEPLYDMLDSINPAQEAKRRGVNDKFTTEKACTQNADVFTTVSEITGMEAEKILGRKPDVLLLNGLDIGKFPTFEVTSIKHKENKERVRQFISYYFFPHYYFDLEHTLFFFIVGRYEYKNKGIDIFIKALGKLNDKLKAENSERTIVVFFWIPREVHGAKAELSLNKASYYQIRDYVKRNEPIIQSKILYNLMRAEPEEFRPELCSNWKLFTKDFLFEAKKLRMNFTKTGNPLLVTHNLPDEENDPITRGLLDGGLDNKEDDKVKVVNYPVYLTGIDGLVDLPYYDAIMACHLGVFPSYYEPWGYTPLESAALGVPALTTDLGGFGRFLQSKGADNKGVFVLKRLHVSEEETVNDFTDILYNYSKLNSYGRVRQKIMAKETAQLADWKELVNNYFTAQNLAIDRIYGNGNNK